MKILNENNLFLIVIRSCRVVLKGVYSVIDNREERKVFRKREESENFGQK